jgi:hypothetical protein
MRATVGRCARILSTGPSGSCLGRGRAGIWSMSLAAGCLVSISYPFPDEAPPQAEARVRGSNRLRSNKRKGDTPPASRNPPYCILTVV